MRHAVSIVLERLEYLGPYGEELAINGAHLAASQIIREIINHPEVDYVELFIPPICMLPPQRLARYAAAVLDEGRKGQGRLRFYPYHSLPEIWADQKPRAIFTVDIGGIVRDRYLRDRFATAPTPISCDVHALGAYQHSYLLRAIAEAEPNNFDGFLCASRATSTALTNWLALIPGKAEPPSHRIDLLPKAVDCSVFALADAETRKRARRMLGWPQDRVIALYLGRVSPYDKADLLPLMAAFEKVSDANHSLAICGAEETSGYYSRLKTEGEKLGKRLIVNPIVRPVDRPLFYQAADLFVFPGDTLQETFGLTVLEAMATGLPVLASDWDGFKDTVVDGETGFLIPTVFVPGLDRVEAFSPTTSRFTDYLLLSQSVWVDSTVLEDRLALLLGSEELRHDMGAKGRRRVESLFGWPRYMKNLLTIWDNQMENALAESSECREARQAAASRVGFPTPYTEVFGHYGSRLLDPDADSVILTALGSAVAQGGKIVKFYDETLPVLHPEVVTEIIQFLHRAGGPVLVKDVCSHAERSSLIKPNDALFHLGLLLKRGAILLHLQCSDE